MLNLTQVKVYLINKSNNKKLKQIWVNCLKQCVTDLTRSQTIGRSHLSLSQTSITRPKDQNDGKGLEKRKNKIK